MVSEGVFVSQLKRDILRLGEARGEVAFGLNPMRPNVRFGSLADILTSSRHVRLTPNNGHWTATQIALAGPEKRGHIATRESAALALWAFAAVAFPRKLWDRLLPSRGVWFSGRSHS